jgi:hypothetical protein
MAYKPGDFFAAVISFFGILVPGAVLLYVRNPMARARLYALSGARY